jgi:hypothetical protein
MTTFFEAQTTGQAATSSIRMARVDDAAEIAAIYRLPSGRLEIRRLARRRLVAPAVARTAVNARPAAVARRGSGPPGLDCGARVTPVTLRGDSEVG